MTNDVINLLCVVGTTPQVVTETVFGLCVAAATDEAAAKLEAVEAIHVITTTAGRDALAGVVTEQIQAMAGDYPQARERLPIDASGRVRLEICVPRGLDGEELDDVRTAVDNALMADEIHGAVRRLTASGMPRLHASLAGGRKTMSYLLGNAMALFGRDGDRLSHVLVGPRAEMCRAFFYPPAAPRTMVTARGEEFDASREQIEICEIPFVRLRRAVEQRPILPRSHVDLTATADQALLGEQRLVVDFELGMLRWGETRLRFTPVQAALLMVLAAEHHAGHTPVAIEELFGRGRLAPVLGEVYRDVLGGDREVFFDREDEYNNCKVQLSGAKAAMAKVLPEYVVARLQPTNVGVRGDVRYTLGIDPLHIEIHGAGEYPGELVRALRR